MTPRALCGDLRSEDALDARRAAKELRSRKDVSALPLTIDALEYRAKSLRRDFESTLECHAFIELLELVRTLGGIGDDDVRKIAFDAVTDFACASEHWIIASAAAKNTGLFKKMRDEVCAEMERLLGEIRDAPRDNATTVALAALSSLERVNRLGSCSDRLASEKSPAIREALDIMMSNPYKKRR